MKKYFYLIKKNKMINKMNKKMKLKEKNNKILNFIKVKQKEIKKKLISSRK